MRSSQSPPRSGVAAAIAAESVAIAVLGLDRGQFARKRLHLAAKRNVGPGERRFLVATGGDRLAQARHAFDPRRRHGDAKLGRLALDRVEPATVARALLQQA